MFAKILNYLLLFICEFLLVWIIAILELLIKGYWGPTPLYFISIFIVAYALTCSTWAKLALTGDKKKKRNLGLISGAVTGFIVLMIDIDLASPLLQMLHLPFTITSVLLNAVWSHGYIVNSVVAIVFQVVFWEIQSRKGVISFRKKKDIATNLKGL